MHLTGEASSELTDPGFLHRALFSLSLSGSGSLPCPCASLPFLPCRALPLPCCLGLLVSLSLSRGSTDPGWAKAIAAREVVVTPVSQQRGCLELCGLHSDLVFVSA